MHPFEDLMHVTLVPDLPLDGLWKIVRISLIQLGRPNRVQVVALIDNQHLGGSVGERLQFERVKVAKVWDGILWWQENKVTTDCQQKNRTQLTAVFIV